MSNQPNITSIRRSKRVLPLGLRVALIVFAAVPLFAHGGFAHVRGAVVRVAKNDLTIKTANGNVEVKLDDKTEFTKNGQKARATDVRLGVRVVIDVAEGSKEKIAHSVKIGTVANTADQRPKDSH